MPRAALPDPAYGRGRVWAPAEWAENVDWAGLFPPPAKRVRRGALQERSSGKGGQGAGQGGGWGWGGLWNAIAGGSPGQGLTCSGGECVCVWGGGGVEW